MAICAPVEVVINIIYLIYPLNRGSINHTECHLYPRGGLWDSLETYRQVISIVVGLNTNLYWHDFWYCQCNVLITDLLSTGGCLITLKWDGLGALLSQRYVIPTSMFRFIMYSRQVATVENYEYGYFWYFYQVCRKVILFSLFRNYIIHTLKFR